MWPELLLTALPLWLKVMSFLLFPFELIRKPHWEKTMILHKIFADTVLKLFQSTILEPSQKNYCLTIICLLLFCVLWNTLQEWLCVVLTRDKYTRILSIHIVIRGLLWPQPNLDPRSLGFLWSSSLNGEWSSAKRSIKQHKDLGHMYLNPVARSSLAVRKTRCSHLCSGRAACPLTGGWKENIIMPGAWTHCYAPAAEDMHCYFLGDPLSPLLYSLG